MEESRGRVIGIDSWTILRTILFVLLFVFLYIIRDLILIILTSVVVASAVEPAIRWFAKNKIPRIPAVVIVYVILGITVAGIFYVFIPIFLEETSNLIAASPQYLKSLELWTSQTVGLEAAGKSATSFSVAELANWARSRLGAISGSVFNTLSTVFGGAASLVLIVVLSFYLAVQKNGISNFLKVVTPYRYHGYIIDLWERSQVKIGKWMQGQLLLSLVIGMLVYLGLTIFGIRNALLFGILAGILEIVPIFGPILSAIPVIAISFVDGGLTLSLMVVGLYVIIQQFENHLLAPIVINKVVGVSPVLVILALIIGAQIAGFLGLILSVPISAALMELVNDIRQKHRILEEKEKGLV
jgi:predicted PurR-regulated permease PerM